MGTDQEREGGGVMGSTPVKSRPGGLLQHDFDDRDVDGLIEHFRDKERRKQFFKEYKELEMLYEIISPDAFLRPYIEDYTTVSRVFDVVRNAYAKRVYVDRAFQKKTNELVQQVVGSTTIDPVHDLVAIDGETIELIKKKQGGDGIRVINLIKSIEKTAEENSDDPFLIALADRANAVQQGYEARQITTQAALDTLFEEIKRNEQRKAEQAERGFDGLTFFVFRSVLDADVENAEAVTEKIRQAFQAHPNWQSSEADLRELRQKATFAVYAEVDDLDRVTAVVDELFSLLQRAYDIG